MILPVLMYHDITANPGKADFLTVPVEKLEQQLRYIRQQGFSTISLRQFHQHLTQGTPLPRKPLLLTFDDGYKSNFELLYPLLRQYGMKAGIFLVTAFVKATGNDKYLQVAELQQMDSAFIDYGYHSFMHNSYGNFSIVDADTDLRKMKAGFQEMGIPMVPLFAYPYGASPRKDPPKMKQLVEIFQKYGIEGAFRIGNRLSQLPAADKYQIQRIDVRGNDPFWKFKLMLRFGRKWIG